MGRLRVQQAQWNLFLFILPVWLLLPVALQADCPAQCLCFPAQPPAIGQEVSCHGKDLRQLPVFPSDMISLDFSRNKLSHIPAGVFPALHNLKSLCLDDNLITHIEPFAFRGIHDYETLSIRRNKHLQQLTKYSLSGMRDIKSLILTDNNISYIEKNAFYGSKRIVVVALYGNPLLKITAHGFNNLRYVHELRIPGGVTEIIPGSFNGLSEVHDIILEDLRIQTLRSETFFNLSNVLQLTIHGAIIQDMNPRAFARTENVSTLTFSHSKLNNLDADIFDGAERFPRVVFEKNIFSRIQLEFPSRDFAETVQYVSNDAECCNISFHNLKVWQSMAARSHFVSSFLHGVWCRSPQWVAEESLYDVNLDRLDRACNGTLDRELEEELLRRKNQKPSLSELYKSKNSTEHRPRSCAYLVVFLWYLLICLIG